MKPRAPQIHGTVKLHKGDKPIRPFVNWKDSSGYKIAKLINTLLNKTLKMLNAFNVPNSNSLVQSLKSTKTEDNTKFCSFDIENMYANIPTIEVNNII
jgi:hypothetical protein